MLSYYNISPYAAYGQLSGQELNAYFHIHVHYNIWPLAAHGQLTLIYYPNKTEKQGTAMGSTSAKKWAAHGNFQCKLGCPINFHIWKLWAFQWAVHYFQI